MIKWLTFLNFIRVLNILMILVCIIASITLSTGFIFAAVFYIVVFFVYNELIKRTKANPGLHEPEGE